MPGQLIGEVCQPSELQIPQKNTASATGEIFLSGGKLYFYSGSGVELITSS